MKIARETSFLNMNNVYFGILTFVATKTTAAKKPKHPAKDAVLAIGKTAPTIHVQNQLENVVKEVALPRSLIGNISAHTTHTTGPHE